MVNVRRDGWEGGNCVVIDLSTTTEEEEGEESRDCEMKGEESVVGLASIMMKAEQNAGYVEETMVNGENERRRLQSITFDFRH